MLKRTKKLAAMAAAIAVAVSGTGFTFCKTLPTAVLPKLQARVQEFVLISIKTTEEKRLMLKMQTIGYLLRELRLHIR